ncbi:MAG: sigma-70 family RNA polymerase sigma factor [Betaproteobacteria bacterium]|nr:sigma-70 family RNA polymerase sigma factor [Betaproteobacteria bacterium]
MPPLPHPDDTAFAALVDTHKAILYKVAHAYCRDPHARRDLMQEMCIQLWRALPSFDAERGVKQSTWVTRIAMNVAISGWRGERGKDAHETVLDIDLDETVAAEDAGGRADDMAVLRRIIDELDELNKALVLLYLEGHDASEIAAVLGLSATNVTTRMTRLKQKLTARFAELEPDS